MGACVLSGIWVVPTSLVLDTVIPIVGLTYSSWLCLCIQFDFFTQQRIGQEDLRVSFLVWHSLLIYMVLCVVAYKCPEVIVYVECVCACVRACVCVCVLYTG